MENYKEKYRKALERAKDCLSYQEVRREDMEYIFPELADSKDEKVRKELIDFLRLPHPHFVGEREKQEEWIDWLEKQGEKPTDKVEPKFKVGDWITDGNCKCQITFIDSSYWYSETCVLGDVESINNRYHLWTIQDVKDGDIVYYECHGNKHLFIVKSVGETKDHVEGYFWYDITSNECEVWDGMLPYSNIASMCDAIPATKEQCDLLFAKMREAGYEWDSERNELKKMEMQGNQVVSEVIKNQKEMPNEFTKSVYPDFWGLIKTGHKMLDADEVIEWLKTHGNLMPVVTIRINDVIAKFKEDFGLC